MCDRNTVNLEGSQTGFIAMIIHPMFANIAECFPKMGPLRDQSKSNELEWKRIKEEKQKEAEEQK